MLKIQFCNHKPHFLILKRDFLCFFSSVTAHAHSLLARSNYSLLSGFQQSKHQFAPRRTPPLTSQMQIRYIAFDTAFGSCGICIHQKVWNDIIKCTFSTLWHNNTASSHAADRRNGTLSKDYLFYHNFNSITKVYAANGLGTGSIRVRLRHLEICRQFRQLTTSSPSVCWRCGSSLFGDDGTSWEPSQMFFCQRSSCRALQPSRDENYFTLFGLSEKYEIDDQELSRRFREIQRVLHPDKTVHLSIEEQAYADDQSALVNKAYDCLLKPVPRALYLLELHGHSLEEGDVTLDAEFLMQIMELNEDISATSDTDQLKVYFDKNRQAINSTVRQISQAFQHNDIQLAKYLIGKIKYYINVEDKIKEKTYFH